ncbi:hypothetical protein HPB47_012258 [Ixodes persulcatus]|uniref:Uncharacterized protein n=1 Tax=Ixodes persulcatus TaxID=34615 RepID=A0AC60NU18_IXOPE|nr:hypothetical protein HPB47_012258 [Ixodes persulcatus]
MSAVSTSVPPPPPRKRVSAEDDIFLLREVLGANHFFTPALWNDVLKGLNAASKKNFSLRGAKEPIDLLVTFSSAPLADEHFRTSQCQWRHAMERQLWRHLIVGLPTTATSATTTPAADPTKPQQKRRQHRKKPTTPPEDPLPPDDFKVVIRPQGGLDLSKTNAAQLADCILRQTKVIDFAQDHVRIHTRSNFIVVSTPDERRAQQYMDLKAIPGDATHYPVQSHIPPPSITRPGAIFQIPAEDSEPLIMEASRTRASCKSSFWGHKYPSKHCAVILRCYPYKRKPEACMACWSAGHRRDVCHKPSPKPHCTICGTLGPTPNHPCQPRCILCGQDHLTGAAGCPKGFQPHRTLPKLLPNIPPTTPGTGPDRIATTFTTPGLTYSQAAQGQASPSHTTDHPHPPSNT